MVMTKLIEPGLKPAPSPLDGVFLSSVLIVFNITYQEGGDQVFLQVTSKSHDLRSRTEQGFWNGGHFVCMFYIKI